jgi:2',3'-cyclic-nucleotide 2'-phosphodiesterase/3'-nucleotidase
MHSWRLILALAAAGSVSWTRDVTVTLLATTDLHGNLYPIDYYTGEPVDRGLAKIASLVETVRRENPNTLLMDCGDTIQGTPLESLYQHYVITGRLPLSLRFSGEPLRGDPMMLAMNRLGYRAMVLGNHEFNFGLKSIERARADAQFPWLSANTAVTPGAKVKPFEPYIVETLNGVKVAVVGLTTPDIPQWEEPAHYRGYRFLPLAESGRAALSELRRKHRPDLVVLAVHDEVDDKLAAAFPGVDAIVFGHTHQQVAGRRVGDVLVVQPKNWGVSLARLDFLLAGAPGDWKVAEKRSRLVRVTEKTPAEEAILRLAQPYHEVTERYLTKPVAEAPAAMDSRLGRVMDSPLVDAIHQVQLYYAKADVSFTALFNTRVTVPKGPVTIRQIAALYIYENELYAVEGTGRMVREALENAARFFRSCPDEACSRGPLMNRAIPGFNYDMAEGVDYEIDLRRPGGQRVVNLRWKGRPLQPEQKLRLAVNNYRAGGSGGYGMFRDAKVLWRSSEDIRSLVISYYMARKKLPAKADDNWRIVPEAARKILEAETLGEGERGPAQ